MDSVHFINSIVHHKLLHVCSLPENVIQIHVTTGISACDTMFILNNRIASLSIHLPKTCSLRMLIAAPSIEPCAAE